MSGDFKLDDQVVAAADRARTYYRGPAPPCKADPTAPREGDPRHCGLCAARAAKLAAAVAPDVQG